MSSVLSSEEVQEVRDKAMAQMTKASVEDFFIT